MRKAMGWACLFVIGCVLTSQAVVIHWSTDGVPAGATSAQLVYVSGGVPSYAGNAIANGSELGDVVSGLAVTPAGVGEQSTTDSTRSQGAYYVVLFKTVGEATYYSYGLTSLAYNDTTAITYNEMAPATGVFTPGSFSGWAPIPEPGTAVLLCLGVAAAALRRKQRV